MATQTRTGPRVSHQSVDLSVYSNRWGWPLLLGVLLVLAGAVALSSVLISTMATVLLFSVIVASAGVLQIAAAFTAHGWRGFSVHLIVGVIGVVIGGMLLLRPMAGASALTFLFATLFFASGIARIVYSLSERFERWGWTLVSGVVSVFLGLVLLAQWPLSSLWFLGMLLGIELLFSGASWIAFSLLLRRGPQTTREAPRTTVRP